VLTWRRELFVPSTLLAEFPQATDTTYLHRLSASNPRAWVVGGVTPATDDDAAMLLADHTFDLTGTAIIASDGTPDSRAAVTPAPIASTVHLAQEAPGRYAVQLDSPAAGMLVVSENWMPGWRVVDARC